MNVYLVFTSTASVHELMLELAFVCWILHAGMHAGYWHVYVHICILYRWCKNRAIRIVI